MRRRLSRGALDLLGTERSLVVADPLEPDDLVDGALRLLERSCAHKSRYSDG